MHVFYSKTQKSGDKAVKTVETSINKGKHAEKAVKTSKIVKLNEKRVEQGISHKNARN